MAARRRINGTAQQRDWRERLVSAPSASESGGSDAASGEPTPLEAALTIVESLLVDDRGPGAACDALRRATGAAEYLVALWQKSGEPTILASRGDVDSLVGPLDTFFAPLRRASAVATLHEGHPEGNEELWCCGCRVPGAEPAVCVVRGPIDPETAKLCRVLVAAIASAEARRAVARADMRVPPSGAEPPNGTAERGAEAGGFFTATRLVRAASQGMQRTYSLVERAAAGDFPVLVVGETGAGKEHVVRLLHESSARSAGPFVAVNCAAIPAELLEAELFGVARGAATGVQERAGRAQQAEGGTLFLDEIGEMPLSLQPKLLRMLDSGEVCPVGGASHRVTARFVAATNVDLESRIREGAFRADLYYRLAGYQIDVPPLRERREDVPLLLEHFLERFSREAGRQPPGLTLGALRALRSYGWPGNVRELEGEVRRLVYVCPEGAPIDGSMLAARVRDQGSGEGSLAAPLDMAAQVRSLEERLIRTALEHSRGHRGEAARMLGISRNWLAVKMRRLQRPGA